MIKIAAPAKPIQGILGIYKRAEFEGKSRRYFYYSKQENLPGDGATAKATSSKSSTKRKDDFVVSDDDQVQVVEPVKKKTKSVTESNPNNKRMSQTAERRQELLIEILEKIKVIEVGKVLETAFNEVLIEKGEETKTRIDKKTFMRSLKTMEDSGIVKFHIVAVPQMNGAFASKTIVFHTSVDLESNQVQQYISKMANKNCTLTGKSKKVLIKIKDVQIERLDSSANKIEPESEIITTDNFNAPIDNTYFSYGQSHVGFDNSFLENPYLSLLSGVQTPPMDDYCSTPMSFTPLNSQALNFTPLSIVSEEFIAPLPIYQESVATNLNAPVIEPAVSTLQNKSEAGWSITIGEENGFINARMLRSKAVHEFLINKLTDSETRSIKNNGVFSFGMLFRDITLDLFLKIIGVFVKSADLDDYLTNSGSRDIMIKDLVGPIRSIIYSKVYKLRSGITKVIETLEIIQVLQSFNGDADCEDRQYKLNLHIPLHDYSAPGSPFLHFCSNVETIEAVASFWVFIINLVDFGIHLLQI